MPLPIWAAMAASQIAGNAANAGMGLLLGKHNDRRQIRQQRRLNELDKEMTIFNMGAQMDMWEKTGYGATKDQIKKAGLNPAMMYGMGGAGGQSTNVETGQSSGAPRGGNEFNGMMGMDMMNIMLTKAQIEKLNAETKNIETDTTKTGGVDTQEAQARIEMLKQGITNAQQLNQIQKIETNLKAIEEIKQGATVGEQIDLIRYQTKMAMKNLDILENEAYISDQTIQDKVKIIKTEAIGAVLKNALTGAQTDAARQGILVDKAQIQKWLSEVDVAWNTLDNEQKKVKLQAIMNEVEQRNASDKNGISNMGAMFYHDKDRITEELMKIMNQNIRQ